MQNWVCNGNGTRIIVMIGRIFRRKGWLRLNAVVTETDFAKVPNLLLQKLPAREFVAETKLELSPNSDGVEAGLIIHGKKHAALTMLNDSKGPRVALMVNNQVKSSEALNSGTARLRVEMKDGGVCYFSFAGADGAFKPIGEPFQATVGTWIGAKIGIFCRTLDPKQTNGHADFDYFHFSSPQQ